MPKLASKYTCTGCMACQDKCPTKAISCVDGNDGHRYIKINPKICIECKLCEKICPIENHVIYGINSLESQFCAGWSNNDCIRSTGATTGIFGSIANSFIHNGGYVSGAVMNKYLCNYIVTNNPSDIKRIQGSKYTSSNPLGVYSKIQSILKRDIPVLFCGLPCHVAALKSFVPIPLQSKLYTIDLICGGVSSPILIGKFVKQNPNVTEIISFRNKDNGWRPSGFRYSLTYKTNDGIIVTENPTHRNLVTDGFACELTDRHSCYNCKFCGSHRKSDLTIGDLWKDTLFTEQHYKGVSSLIIHSNKGKELLDSSNITYYNINPFNILNPNHRIFNCKSIKRYFPERKMMNLLFRFLPYSYLMKIYAGDLRTKNCIWWPFAAYRIISFKIAEIIQKKQTKKILKQIFK